jgi:hypothetical protein
LIVSHRSIAGESVVCGGMTRVLMPQYQPYDLSG